MSARGRMEVEVVGKNDGLKRALAQSQRDIANTTRQVDRGNTSLARNASRAAAQVLRIFESGNVSAKKLDKLGKSVGGVVSSVEGFAGGIGVALGLGALPALSDISVKAIDAIKQQMKGLGTETREAAAAQRSFQSAQLAASGSQDAVAASAENLTQATNDLNAARKSGKASASEITKLERDQRNAYIDLHTAQAAQTDAQTKAKDAAQKYGKQIQDVVDKSTVYTKAAIGGRGAIIDQAASAEKAAAALRKQADSAAGLTDDQRAAFRATADLIEKEKKIPDNLKTLVQTPGLNPAIAGLDTMRRQADALDGRTVRTTIIQDTIREDHRLNLRAKGGPVTAPTFFAGEEAPQHPEFVIATNPAYRSDNVKYWMDAGRALGIPGFARGGKFSWPHKRRREKASDFHSRTVDYGQSRGQSIMDVFSTELSDFDRETSRGDEIRGRDGTTSASDLAYDRDRAKGAVSILEGSINWLRGYVLPQLKRHKVPRGDFARMLHDLSQDLRDRKTSLGSAQYAVDHPAIDKSDSPSTPETNEFANQQSFIRGVNSGLGRLSSYITGGSGDIGRGGANALSAAGGGPTVIIQTLHPGDPKTLAAVAAAANGGNTVANLGRVYNPRTGLAM